MGIFIIRVYWHCEWTKGIFFAVIIKQTFVLEDFRYCLTISIESLTWMRKPLLDAYNGNCTLNFLLKLL
jgi:hypothetical protein